MVPRLLFKKNEMQGAHNFLRCLIIKFIIRLKMRSPHFADSLELRVGQKRNRALNFAANPRPRGNAT